MKEISNREILISIAALGETIDLNMQTVADALEIISQECSDKTREELEGAFQKYTASASEMVDKYTQIRKANQGGE